MADELGSMKNEIAELRKLLQAPTSKGGKDIWEKISALSTLFSSVILGAVGLFDTQVYNERQLRAAAAGLFGKRGSRRRRF
jgi:hypothetical protein